MRALYVRRFGDEGAPAIACLHGVTSWGGHFESLAARLGPAFRVLAPDLHGHGDSGREPPWRISDHLEHLEAALGEGPTTWLGHSFGGRLAFEWAAAHRGAVERLVLLDPAIFVPPHVALWAAENARTERRYASFEDAIDRRFEESQLHRAPRDLLERELRGHLVEEEGWWRYRYSQAAVVAAHGEMATAPPPFAAVRVPTLLVLGDRSYLPYDHLLDAHRAALGDLLEVVVVPGGHSVLWDALDETAAAVGKFLAAPA
ncbi:MAG TPA: alpha/beta hydrolase [Gaiella sp.]|nr:alpha/beta hydrolase [Gaiella sp.]